MDGSNNHTMNTTTQPTPTLLAFGFIGLPQKYEDEKDVTMGLVALISIISIITNGILSFVIFKDPFKRLRSITAILLAFNSVTNLSSSLVLVLDNVTYWSHGELDQKLVLFFCSFNSLLYIIGNFLHTLNTYGAITLPVRYAALAPKIRKVLVQYLIVIWVIILLVVIIPPYTLPEDKVLYYMKGMLTLLFCLFALLVITFIYLYTKIFRTLYTRKQRLTLSYHLRRSTVSGRRISKRNQNIVKTLFIQVLFFLIIAISCSVIFLLFLHCKECDLSTLKLTALFTVPVASSSMVFLPLLWLIRLKSYRQALIKIFAFWPKKAPNVLE